LQADGMGERGMVAIERIALPVVGIEQLQIEARAEGYKFIDRLVEEWASGVNRFDGTGEMLFGCFDDGLLVGVGGLNCDPFAGRADVGRVRRVYVRAAWRKRGIGRALVGALILEARKSFVCVRLRAENADAGRLYEGLGFVRYAGPDATHILRFEELKGDD